MIEEMIEMTDVIEVIEVINVIHVIEVIEVKEVIEVFDDSMNVIKNYMLQSTKCCNVLNVTKY